jgi:hypothetical protein
VTEYKEQAHIKNIPQQILVYAIEAIGESLIEDARLNYGHEAGFNASITVKGKEGVVIYNVRFMPYNYTFKWLVAPEEDGFLVTFIGSVPNRWFEFVSQSREKLRGLMDTQWAALLNFGIGFVTANYYAKGKGEHAKTHVARAKEHIKKRSKTEHTRTHLG